MAESYETQDVTVVGFGNIGGALAEALLASGHRVTVWYRTASKCAQPAPRGRPDIAVAEWHITIGASRDRHDLSGLDAPLRSHGRTTELRVPVIVNRASPSLDPARPPRNFDACDVALNHAETGVGRPSRPSPG